MKKYVHHYCQILIRQFTRVRKTFPHAKDVGGKNTGNNNFNYKYVKKDENGQVSFYILSNQSGTDPLLINLISETFRTQPL